MSEVREASHRGAMDGVRIMSIVDAAGWWLLVKDDEDAWRREPLAAWALVDDGGRPFVTGLSADGLDVVELCDHPARYVHESTFPACMCARSKVVSVDGFCEACAGIARSAA